MEIFIVTIIAVIIVLLIIRRDPPAEAFGKSTNAYKNIKEIAQKYSLRGNINEDLDNINISGSIGEYHITLQNSRHKNNNYLEAVIYHRTAGIRNFSIKSDSREFFEKLFSRKKEVYLGIDHIDDISEIIGNDKEFIFAFLNQNVRNHLSYLHKLNLQFLLNLNKTSIRIPMYRLNKLHVIATAIDTAQFLALERAHTISIADRYLENLQSERNKTIITNSIIQISRDVAKNKKITAELRKRLSYKDKTLQLAAAAKLEMEGAHHAYNMLTNTRRLFIKHKINIISILRENNYNTAIIALHKEFKKTTVSKYKKALLLAFEELYNDETGDFIYKELHLKRNKNKELKYLIIKCLGICGKKHHIKKLKQLIKLKKTQENGLVLITEDSIKKLQEKFGLDKGLLSISEEKDKGFLSISEDSSGNLSVNNDIDKTKD